MSGTQWRQEKEVRQEKLARLEEMKDSALVTSSWVKERLEVLVGDVWCVDWQCVIISSDISTPTTSPPVPRPPSPPWARAKVVSPVPQPKSNILKYLFVICRVLNILLTFRAPKEQNVSNKMIPTNESRVSRVISTNERAELWFEEPGQRFGMDLAAINLQRGREHGVAGWGRWRDWCGLQPLSDWEDLHGIMPNTSVMVRRCFSIV